MNRSYSFIGDLLAAAVMAGAITAAPIAQAEPASAPSPVPSPVPGDPGAKPFPDDAVYRAFHGREGVHRVVETLIDLSVADPRISEIFKGQDLPHLKEMLEAQVCYVLGGPCVYKGKDMKSAHKDLGIQMSDFNALVEDLQKAMDREGVPFRDQNRLLAKLAPMERDVVVRSGGPAILGH
jgi:hemoglobin